MKTNERIKFRAKRIDNGAWVYGYYMAIAGTHKILTFNPYSASGATYYDVDASTVGQFTGMKDQNGKEIYEGDIVEAYKNPLPSEVIFDDGEYDIYCPMTYEYETLHRARGHSQIIGNKHDNPELLKL